MTSSQFRKEIKQIASERGFKQNGVLFVRNGNGFRLLLKLDKSPNSMRISLAAGIIHSGLPRNERLHAMFSWNAFASLGEYAQSAEDYTAATDLESGLDPSQRMRVIADALDALMNEIELKWTDQEWLRKKKAEPYSSKCIINILE